MYFIEMQTKTEAPYQRPQMSDIIISKEGVLKHLANLNANKDDDPDNLDQMS
jgi:hypothetical protein